jgi:hypothetical protein
MTVILSGTDPVKIQTYFIWTAALYLLSYSMTILSPGRHDGAVNPQALSRRAKAYPWRWLISARFPTTYRGGVQGTEVIDCQSFWKSVPSVQQTRFKSSKAFLQYMALHRHEPLPTGKSRSGRLRYPWPWITTIEREGIRMNGRTAWESLSYNKRREIHSFSTFIQAALP